MGDKARQDSAAVDPRVAYLRGLGLKDMTAADLVAPDVGKFTHTAADGFRWSGRLHRDFEYYRAHDDRSIQVAEDQGYFRLPTDCGVRMVGVHTKTETIMARTTEVGDAYREAQRRRIDAEAKGTFDNQVPLGGGIYSNERIERTQGASPMGG